MKLPPLAGTLVARVRALTPTAVRDGPGIAGLGFVAYGAHEVYHPAGWIVLGLELSGGALLAAAARARAAQPKAET
jgi:hypothetical protein